MFDSILSENLRYFQITLPANFQPTCVTTLLYKKDLLHTKFIHKNSFLFFSISVEHTLYNFYFAHFLSEKFHTTHLLYNAVCALKTISKFKLAKSHKNTYLYILLLLLRKKVPIYSKNPSLVIYKKKMQNQK